MYVMPLACVISGLIYIWGVLSVLKIVGEAQLPTVLHTMQLYCRLIVLLVGIMHKGTFPGSCIYSIMYIYIIRWR